MLQPHAGYEKLQSVYGAYSITIFAILLTLSSSSEINVALYHAEGFSALEENTL
jgi:hypothetical protein